jgi:hypothetical protein
MKAAEFLSPKDLEVNEAKIDTVLITGCCAAAAYPSYLTERADCQFWLYGH